jgi:redox-sensitive bicupin YhaK (pirin superfamily)
VDSTIGLHPHEGFEIMSFVLKGNIRHYDTKLKEWRPLKAGDVQIIRAGNGISHAEFIAQDGAIFQIWFDPDLSKTLNKPASYDDYAAESLPIRQEGNVSVKTYIGDGAPVTLDTQGLEVLRFDFDETDYRRAVSTEKIHSLYVINGNFNINGEEVKANDYVILKDTDELHIESREQGDLFMISSPARLDYLTYAQMMQERMKA